jgi:hypothetical protein
MIRIGYILLIVGFLGCSIVASLHPTIVNWPAYGIFAVAAIVGVFFIRKARKADASSGEMLEGNRDVLHKALHNIERNLEDLKSRKTDIPTYEMRFEIDKLFRDDLRNFADARESLKHLYGLASFADVMSAFAAGERYINRIWSASTDGYVDEVLEYVDRAHLQFIEAREKLDKAALV